MVDLALPPVRHWVIWPGNSGFTENPKGLELVFKTAVDGTVLNLAGRSYVFTVARLPQLTKRSDDGSIVVNATEGYVLVPISVAESRLFELGPGYDYELEERVNTTQTTILYGSLIVRGGQNVDN